MRRFGLAVILAPVVLCAGILGCGGNQGASSGTNPINPAPDFTLTTQPTQLSITTGSTASLTVNLAWSGAPSGPVSVSATYPSGISAGTSLPATIPAGSTSASVTLSAATSTLSGNNSIALTATATGISHTYTVPITVFPGRTLLRTGFVLAGDQAESMVYDKAHKLLWAAIPNLGQVVVIDPGQRKLLKRLNVPLAGQMDLSLDGTQIVVGSDTIPVLTFIDLASETVLRTVTLTSDVLHTAYPGTRQYVAASDDPPASPVISFPRFVAGGDVVFLGLGSLFRWSSATNTISACKTPSDYGGTSLARTPDGTKVLITAGTNGLQVYDPATNSISAQNSTYTYSIAAADPVNARFAVITGPMQILDVNLNQLASVPIDPAGTNYPYGTQFSLDGTQIFVAESGQFTNLPVVQTIDATKYALGSAAPLTNFGADGPETPLAIDENNVIYGGAIGGIAIDDPLNYYKSSPIPGGSFVQTVITPDHGPVAAPSAVSLENRDYQSLTNVYVDGIPATINNTSQTAISVTAPAIPSAGPVTLHAFQSDGSFSAYPAGFTYGVQAVALEPSAGPPAGGITADLLAYGVGAGPSSVTLTVGGTPAQINSIRVVGGAFPYLLPLYDIQFVVPPGAAATAANVSVTASGYTDSLPDAFTYEPALTNYPFPSSSIPNSIVFDANRQQAYLISPTRIDVFSLATNSFLSPIIPPTKNGTLGITGLDLSVDGKTMVVADMIDQTLAVIDPDNASSANLVTFAPNNFGLGYKFGPRSVVANSKGTYFVSSGNTTVTGGGGEIWEFDPVANTLSQRVGPLNASLEISGCRLLRSQDGKLVVIQAPDSQPATAGVWNASTDTFAFSALPGLTYDAAVSPDGTLISTLVDTAGAGIFQFNFDSSFNVLVSPSDPNWLHTGWLWGSFFDPSGTLFYVADNDGLDIYDTHTGHLQRRIGVKEAPNTSVYTAATSDETGNTLLLLTNNGLDVIQDVPPLAIRSVSPLPNTASAGSVITLKGTSFVAGATVTIAGQSVPTTVTDSHTLAFSLPVVVAGNTLTLTNPDGSAYTY